MNSFTQTINITTGEHVFGDIVPNNMSEYKMLHSGQYVTFPPSVIDFTNETAFFLWWFVCDGRVNYKIMSMDGRSCMFTQTLKYGSSYTLVVRPDITFGDQVTREFRVCKKAFFLSWCQM